MVEKHFNEKQIGTIVLIAVIVAVATVLIMNYFNQKDVALSPIATQYYTKAEIDRKFNHITTEQIDFVPRGKSNPSFSLGLASRNIPAFNTTIQDFGVLRVNNRWFEVVDAGNMPIASFAGNNASTAGSQGVFTRSILSSYIGYSQDPNRPSNSTKYACVDPYGNIYRSLNPCI